MKISTTPTSFILIKAETNSEWDSCDFAIIAIDEKWKKEASERLQAAQSFRGNESYYCQVYWDAPVGYFCDNDVVDYRDELSQSENGFIYLSIELIEVASLEEPTSRLDTHMFKITKEGYGHFKAYGKYTSEEYWTDSFPIEKIINL